MHRELAEKLETLRRRRRAVILAHNYQPPEVQDIADFVGDSLELARKAMETDADVIVLAGVRFMAETAKLLNPDRIVLHPVPDAGCPLADFLTLDAIREARREHPGAPVVLYINSHLDAKAEADYIVTSSSAVKLVSMLEDDTVLFGPDRNLADYVAENLPGKRIVSVPLHGHCPVHQYLITARHVEEARRRYPGARVLIHPEAPREARKLADYVGSTSQMVRYIGETKAHGTYLLGTEEGLAYRARKLYPTADVKPLNPKAICRNMKKITLRSIVEALERLAPRVELDPVQAKKARETVERSLEMLKKN